MKKKILRVLGVIFIVFVALFVILKIGISIPSLNFEFLKLEQLYIKIDKKLIVNAKKINIKENANSTVQYKSLAREIQSISKSLKYLYFFAQEINIENLNFKGQEIQFLFKNNEFFINNSNLFLKLNIEKKDQEIHAYITQMNLKDYNASMQGNFVINTKSEFYYFNGFFKAEEADFNLSFSYKKQQLAYKIENANIYDLGTLLYKVNQKYNLDPSLLEWVGNKVKGSYYYLDFISGFMDLEKNKIYADEIKAQGYAKDVEIKLAEHIKAIKIPHLDLNLSQQKLDFKFKEAKFKDYDISQSKVYLYDILKNDKIGIFLHLKSDQILLDQDVNEILKLYHISLPFNQINGSLKSDLTLDIPFASELRVRYFGEFEMRDSKLDLLDLNLSKAKVVLKDEKVDIFVLNLQNSNLQAELNASIDFKQKDGFFDVNLAHLTIPSFLEMKNENVNFLLDFKEKEILKSEKWGLELDLSEGLFLRILSPEKFENYSTLLQRLKIQKVADATFYTKDFENFEIVVKDGIFMSDFYNENTPYNKDSFFISKDKNGLKIRTQSDMISADFNEQHNNIFIKNLKLSYKNSDNENFLNEIFVKPTLIKAQNSALYLQDFNKTLSFDELNAEIKKDEVQILANTKQAKFDFYSNSKKVTLKISNVNDEVLNDFFGRNLVENGEFNLWLEGANLQNFESKIWLNNTHFTDLKFHNQLVSFIDTIPSLLLFKTPTFNEKGLSVQRGVLALKRRGDILTLEGLNLDGDSIDILGTGTMNLKSNTIDANLQLKTLKSTSDFIAKVPIVNQIILGKNREISTTVKVDGKIDDPKFHTQILADTLKTPLNLIKNIFELPANLFN